MHRYQVQGYPELPRQCAQGARFVQDNRIVSHRSCDLRTYLTSPFQDYNLIFAVTVWMANYTFILQKFKDCSIPNIKIANYQGKKLPWNSFCSKNTLTPVEDPSEEVNQLTSNENLTATGKYFDALLITKASSCVPYDALSTLSIKLINADSAKRSTTLKNNKV